MIRIINDRYFALTTPRSAYAFRVTDSGHLEHLHYGAACGWTEETKASVIAEDCMTMAARRAFPPGNAISYSPDFPLEIPEDSCCEVSARGKGDLRDPFVSVRFADGSNSLDWKFESAELLEGTKEELSALPSSYAEAGKADTLKVTLKDAHTELRLVLTYCVFRELDVITRSARLVNGCADTVRVQRLMSSQLDFPDDGYIFTSFHGSWAREMEKESVPVQHTRIVNSTAAGTSSSRSNPFVMLGRAETSETAGPCYGLNLVWSGNHYSSAEVNAYGKTRFLTGMSPEDFEYLLKPGEELQAPEAVMAFSGQGFGGLSRVMHPFVREHIVRGTWKNKPRPVLLNSWEAAYFDIDEGRFLKLARGAAEAGMELVVLDDGWFGNRKDDRRALGDWTVNRKKFPSGLRGLRDRLGTMGLGFGLWIEPEMVNTDSDLYRAHPEWAMDIPGRDHSEGRTQRIIDLCRQEAVDHLINAISDILRDAGPMYIKWDMNRVFSDVFSKALPAEQQGEVHYRYMLGFYRLMKSLTEAFPDILFEGCASGGNRFDLGILCYCPQIWASDDTDALVRVRMQENYSYGYPMSSVSAHVSAVPNHQTLRNTPLSTRYNVACFGSFGYELNLADLPGSERAAIKDQVAQYKQWRDVLQNGTFYRLESGNIHKWICVSLDRRRAVALFMQELAVPNMQQERFRAEGLDPDLYYHLYSLPHDVDIRQFGDLVNTVAPIHIKQNSLAHNAIARFYKMKGEEEDMAVSGAVLMNAGVSLAPAYGGTGFNDQTRCFSDYTSRLYFIEAI